MPAMTPIEQLRYLLLAAQREGNRFLADALEPLGLTPSQAEALRVLQDWQPLALVELGGLLVCEQGSPSRLVAVVGGLPSDCCCGLHHELVPVGLPGGGRSPFLDISMTNLRPPTRSYSSRATYTVLCALPVIDVDGECADG